ncbi:MAG: AbrB/MazE/SpoVT family DNA-binding domain-containing protein [Ideonella sp.]|nr:AbrB/MazE/SpoVT family DNA-binding domain-containing protein [Ideonella sp.]MCC7458786.1 AbrB/MazE/SpoVT family DNA-binding domain-containing protein [Nitrospira sp.]
METATVTSKSQITLPKAVRVELGVGPGDKIQFVPAARGYRLVVIKSDLPALRGMFKGRRAQPLSIDEMNRTIAQMGRRSESAMQRAAKAKARRR